MSVNPTPLSKQTFSSFKTNHISFFSIDYPTPYFLINARGYAQDFDSNDSLSVNTEKFNYLRYSTITSFFTSNQVDVPLCFKKSLSLFNQPFELPVLKFCNIFMRHGRRSTMVKTLSHTLKSLNRQNKASVKSSYELKWQHWAFLYTYNHYSIAAGHSYLTHFNLTLEPSRGAAVKASYVGAGEHLTKDYLLEPFNRYAPVFSFSVQKVDKSVRKHSRGKSGKYSVSWKYVPAYKRVYTVMRWFVKDVRFQKAKTFQERLYKALFALHFNFESTFVSRCCKFNHAHVFKNFKKSLLRTLRTTT